LLGDAQFGDHGHHVERAGLDCCRGSRCNKFSGTFEEARTLVDRNFAYADVGPREAKADEIR
jgi:hypothetical protein